MIIIPITLPVNGNWINTVNIPPTILNGGSTFMIATDPYLQQFVREFTQVNNGKAYFSGLNGLGDFIFEDFERGKRKAVK